MGGRGYLSYQDTFAWRKITFLWSDNKIWGTPAPFLSPMLAPTHLLTHGTCDIAGSVQKV